MHIQSIKIQNYRSFNEFQMAFHEGLNVIIGANNSGKTGLLHAIQLLQDPSNISVDDFNKNNLIQFKSIYMDEAPSITIEYEIHHKINESNTEDESIIKLLPFLGVQQFIDNRHQTQGGTAVYNITVHVKAVYSLDNKFIEEYKKAVLEEAHDFDSYLSVLKRFVNKTYYAWHYTNGVSDSNIESKYATNIFDIRFIGAERTNEEAQKETKREIISFIKKTEDLANLDKFTFETSKTLQETLQNSIAKLSELFSGEADKIGLKKGNVSIASAIRANLSLDDTYNTAVQDTKNQYILPLDHNGLGYNNLINICMLIKLADLYKGKNFRILCLEEPEAHLHPAMQYKLFKYLRELNQTNDLGQQIFVTTHSSNISAVAGIDNIFMLAYNRDTKQHDCCQQSLLEQFHDDDGSHKKQEAKIHLSKFLDVTRSDMLFADKVILVEGIAEKLLLPLFLEKDGHPYEDEHISIVEIGGKHFKYFIELFNENKVNKKVLCITDKDFDWEGEDKNSRIYEEYKSYEPEHIRTLNDNFKISNLKIVTQSMGGRTFEDELFLSNFDTPQSADTPTIAETIFKKAVSKNVQDFCGKYHLNAEEWCKHIDEMDNRSQKPIKKYIELRNNRIEKDSKNKEFYDKYMFAEIFLHYVKGQKGNIALELLTDNELYDNEEISKLCVPQYIKDGLEWLLK